MVTTNKRNILLRLYTGPEALPFSPLQKKFANLWLRGMRLGSVYSLPEQSCLYLLYLFCLKCLKACCRVSNINKLKLHSLKTPYQNIHLNVASYNKECIHEKINFSPKELLKNAVKGFGIVFYRLINVHTNFREI